MYFAILFLQIEDDTKIELSENKLWEEYEEAKILGIETKPVLLCVKNCKVLLQTYFGDYLLGTKILTEFGVVYSESEELIDITY